MVVLLLTQRLSDAVPFTLTLTFKDTKKFCRKKCRSIDQSSKSTSETDDSYGETPLFLHIQALTLTSRQAAATFATSRLAGKGCRQ